MGTVVAARWDETGQPKRTSTTASATPRRPSNRIGRARVDRGRWRAWASTSTRSIRPTRRSQVRPTRRSQLFLRMSCPWLSVQFKREHPSRGCSRIRRKAAPVSPTTTSCRQQHHTRNPEAIYFAGSMGVKTPYTLVRSLTSSLGWLVV
jgi:hypothetical protein